MALLLGALLIQGVTPGPEMLTSKLDFTFSLMWMLAIANVAGALLLMLIARKLALLTFVDGRLIVPVITLFVFMGAWLASSNIGDWLVLMIFGVVGYVMKQGAVPRPPMVLGFVIGPIMENALFITTNAYDGLSWLGRPICLAIGVLVVVSIVAGARRKVRHAEGRRILIEFGRADPTMSLIAVGMLLAFSIYGLAPTYSWADDVGRIPMLTFVPAICMSLLALRHGVREIRKMRASGGNFFSTRIELDQVAQLYLWWLGVLAITIVAGQIVALPIFVALYILFVGKYAWWIALLSALGTWTFLHVLFDRVIAVIWYPSLLFH